VKALSIVVELPPPELSPNGRHHWRVKAKATQTYRYACGTVALAELNGRDKPRWKRARLQIAWYAPTDRRRPDPDNIIAWLKAALDSLKDAGVLADDRDLTIEPPLIDVDAEHPRVLLHVTGMDEEATDAA
jgi:crossover junction endodeoxyribonuclease RusA